MNRAHETQSGNRRSRACLVLLLLGAVGTSPAFSQAPPVVTPPPIQNEIPGQATRAWFQYLTQPEVAQRSWAAVSVFSNKAGFDSTICSGTMIGPNMMLTAAHCGAEWVSGVEFIAYAGPKTKLTEKYVCRTLLFGWPETDIDLVWCGARGGVNPGDRWGYVDLDVDVDPRLRLVVDRPRYKPIVGLPIYSNWWNPVDGLGTSILYSEGTVGNIESGGWFNMGGSPCSNDDDLSDGVAANIYGIGGSSGSGMLTAATHRLQLGPTSTAPSGGGNNRWSASLFKLLTEAKLSHDTSGLCAQRAGEPVNTAALQTLWDVGIKFDPDRNNSGKYYDAILDADGNGMFDIQQDLEKSAGEAQRSFYNLGFDSLRRALLWQTGDAAKFAVRPFWGAVNINAEPGDWQQHVIGSPQLHLAYPAPHWVRYHVRATGAARLRMRVGGGQHIESLSPGTDRIVVQEVRGVNIAIDVAGTGRITLSDFTVWNPAKPFTFDMFDERKVWKRKAVADVTPDVESAAIFMPHDRQAPYHVEWAGLIRASRSHVVSTGAGGGGGSGVAVDDRLYSQAMATPTSGGPGRIRVCFDHKLFGAGPHIGQGSGRLAMAGTSGAEHEFTATGTWQTSCTSVRRGKLTALEFRALPLPVGSNAILIDNVSLSYTPIPVVTDVPAKPSVQ